MKIKIFEVFKFVSALAKAKEIVSGKEASIDKVKKLIEDVKKFDDYLKQLKADLESVISDIKVLITQLKNLEKKESK